MITHLIKILEPFGLRLNDSFFMDELPEDMIDLIDESYHNLNKHGRQLLQIALTSKKSRNEILDTLDLLKENYDGNNRVSFN